MKIRVSRERGSIMVIALVVAGVIGLALASYLSLVGTQNTLAVRSEAWNAALPVAEAGIDEAIAHLNTSATNLECNGWTLVDGNYVKERTFADGYYSVAISANSTPVAVVSQGFVRAPYQNNSYISRTVRVNLLSEQSIPGALVVKTTVNLNGNNVLTDSFDSTDPAKSVGGQYSPLIAGDKGDITALGGMINSPSNTFTVTLGTNTYTFTLVFTNVGAGNADVWGRIRTGPAGGFTLGPNGSVGDVAWHKAGMEGLKPGWFTNSAYFTLPDVQPPFAAAAPPAGGTIDGVKYDYVFYSGNYMMPTLTKKVFVKGNATVYVTDSINFGGGKDTIKILPGGSLNIYMGGSVAIFNTPINPGSTAKSLMYYGLPKNTIVVLMAQGEVTGTFYAPQAAFLMNGQADLYGRIVAYSATLSGSSAFHFDESLGMVRTANTGYAIISWDEL